jgi:DNA-binding beta-propeller fold protein YncE
VINGATNAAQTLSDPNAKNPSAVAVNSATNKIYVANWSSNNVTVIDGAHE